MARSSRMVAYRELAKGQDERLQRPETLYSLRQKFWFFIVEVVGDGEEFERG